MLDFTKSQWALASSSMGLRAGTLRCYPQFSCYICGMPINTTIPHKTQSSSERAEHERLISPTQHSYRQPGCLEFSWKAKTNQWGPKWSIYLLLISCKLHSPSRSSIGAIARVDVWLPPVHSTHFFFSPALRYRTGPDWFPLPFDLCILEESCMIVRMIIKVASFDVTTSGQRDTKFESSWFLVCNMLLVFFIWRGFLFWISVVYISL